MVIGNVHQPQRDSLFSMRIGFDISQTGKGKAGCGFFAHCLICALIKFDRENQYVLYPYFGNTFWEPDVEKATCRISSPNVERIALYNDRSKSMEFWKNLSSEDKKLIGDPDIIHSNNFFCPKKLTNTKIVYTLHDISFIHYPEFHDEANRWICFKGVYNASLYADFIIAVSDFTRNSFLDMFPHFPAERIQTIHEGSRFSLDQVPGTISSHIRELSPDGFWLAVGTLEPRKNLKRLLKAYAIALKSFHRKMPLALAGGKGWLENNLEDFIRRLGISEYIRFLGYVSDDDLLWLYKNCYAFVYPSIYEGFGLPVLEAMDLGAAVILSETTSLPEVGGKAAVYINPFEEEDLVKKLILLEKDINFRNERKLLSKKQAAHFSWEKCAEHTLQIYDLVISSINNT